MRSSDQPLVKGMMALTGIGTGLRLMPGTLHGVGYFPQHISSIVSLIQLANSLGGTFATTIMLNIFNGKLRAEGVALDVASTASLDAIAGLSQAAQVLLRDRAREGIALAFFAISAFMWLGLVLMVGLGNVDIGKKGEKEDEVVKGTYLGSLFRRGESKV